ncbi:MAG: efflux RND transporter periplasmic adaptor subunit, partial [Lentisphaeria bacterium]
ITQVVNEGAMSLQEQTNAESLYFAAKAQLEIAEKAFDDTVLRSPFDGVVSTRFVDNFENVQAKQAIMRVLNNREFKITVDMPDELFMRGMSVDLIWVELNLYPGVKFPATLSEHDREASPSTGTYAVTLQFVVDREKYPVEAGISGQVFGIFSDKTKDDFRLVPPSSLLNIGQETYVLIFDNGLVKRKKIELAKGNFFSNGSIKVSGLNDGEVVITAGVYDLEEGQKVKLLGQ